MLEMIQIAVSRNRSIKIFQVYNTCCLLTLQLSMISACLHIKLFDRLTSNLEQCHVRYLIPNIGIIGSKTSRNNNLLNEQRVPSPTMASNADMDVGEEEDGLRPQTNPNRQRPRVTRVSRMCERSSTTRIQD